MNNKYMNKIKLENRKGLIWTKTLIICRLIMSENVILKMKRHIKLYASWHHLVA